MGGCKTVVDIDITGFMADGIRMTTFTSLVDFMYTENEDVIPENPSDVTELVCLAEQVGVPQLVRTCERRLIEFLAFGNGQQENYVPLAAFAARHNLRRLARHIEVEMSLAIED